MGEVYQARDERLNRMVALKVLPAELVANTERRRRFVQEAQLASSLQHPNIITIFDIGSAEDGEYLAMELVRGRTLDQLIPQKGLRLQDALRYSIQITDALSAAHGAGIVHRDLKPGNIMVTDQGQIKVLDFGLATLTESEPMTAADETRVQSDAVKTGAGTILGTVAYMSPEQAEGRKVDARSDIFSFGSILYEMLSGKRAFRADSTPGTLAAVINLEPQPLAKVADDVPQAVEQLVSRCLRKDLNRRAQHASDIKVALEDLQEDSSSGSLQRSAAVSTPAKAGGVNMGIVGAGLVAVLAIGAAVWGLWPVTPPPPTSFAPVALTSLPGSEGSPDLSPDGSQVVFAWTREGAPAPDIYVQLIGAGATPLRLTDDGSAHGLPVWAPDGKSIAFWHASLNASPVNGSSRAVLTIISALGGTERRLLEWNGAIRRIDWSRDGRWLVTSPATIRAARDRGITFISPTTGERIDWVALDKSYEESTDPALSPDGRQIAFIKLKDDFSADLFVAPVTADGKPGGPARLIQYGGREARNPVWTANGRELLIVDGSPNSNGTIMRVPLDGSGPGIRLAGVEHPNSFSTSADGSRLVFSRSGGNADLWRIDLENPGASGRVAASTLHDEGGSYSSDGSRVAFSSNRSGPREIWVADVTGNNALALTSFGGPVPGTARWSPDDTLIAFDARLEGNSEIFVVPSGGGQIRPVVTNPAEDGRPFWSRDGRWLYFSSNRSGQNEIWRMPVEGGEPTPLTKEGGLYGALSHDDRWLYYSGGLSGDIRRIGSDGSGQSVEVAQNSRFLSLTTSAKGLWFVSFPKPGDNEVVVRLRRATDNVTVDVARIDFLPTPVGMAVSPDEKSLLVTRPDVSGSDLFLVDDFR
jgi:serine/threonine protein kinase